MNESNSYLFYTRNNYRNTIHSLSLYPWRTHEDSFCESKQKNVSRITKRRLFQGKKSKGYSNLNSMFNVFLKNSSIYALNRIANSSTPCRKIFWVVILIIGVVGCVSQVGQYLSAYYQYPVVVNFESTSVNKIEFPSVTVCNLNSVRNSWSGCWFLQFNLDVCDDITKLISSNSETKEPTCESVDKWSNFNDLKLKDYLTPLNYESRITYGHQLKDFIVSCKFGGVDCGFESFIQTNSYEYGNCYTFNSNGSIFVQDAGPTYGLELEFDLEIKEYSFFSRSAGVRAQIHQPNLMHDIVSKGVVLPAGHVASIAVAKSEISRLSAPFKDHCKDYDVGDSLSLCNERCLDEVSRRKCFCSVTENKHNDGVKQCNKFEWRVLCCLYEIQEALVCDCPLSCRETQYNIQLTSAVWPSLHYYQRIIEELARSNKSDYLNYDDFRNSHLMLNVYYDTLDYTIYTQNAKYQSSELLSQIGGQMGLWLGLSLIAIFECFENIIILCRGRRIIKQPFEYFGKFWF